MNANNTNKNQTGRRALESTMQITYTPSITSTTSTLDIVNQLVDAVGRGVRRFRLGRFTARWEGGTWLVHDGCEDRLTIGGLAFALPQIVRCWMADDWDL